MSTRNGNIYEFGSFRLDPAEHLLTREGVPVLLTPKAFQTLVVLVERSGHLVEKDEIIQKVWPDAFVEEVGLARNISSLRKALGEGPAEHRYIETVPKSGYRFVAEVKDLGNGNTGLIVEKHIRAQITEEEEEARPQRDADEMDADSQLRFSKSSERAVIERTRVLAAPSISAVEHVESQTKRRKRRALIATLAIAVTGVSFWLYTSISRFKTTSLAVPFQTMKITRLTSTGKVGDAAISPDGKYLVYVVEDAGQRSLWIRQLATNSNVQIALPSDLLRQKALSKGLTFSRDGNYIFLVSGDRTEGSLYQMPTFGGVAKKIIEDVDTPVTLSPDGKRLAFVRYYPILGETSLIVANADGTGEQRLATRKDDGFPLEGPVWSPDGKIIACAARKSHGADSYATVVGVRVEDGTETPFTSQRWRKVGRLAWLLDGSGLVMPAMDQGSAPFNQIWHLSYPNGEARRITNDLNDYGDVSLTGDSGSLVTVLSDQHSNIWIAPNGASARAAEVSSNNSDGTEGIFWTPDGKIVYTSNVSGNEDLWIMNADGSGQKQLTVNAGRNFAPSVSPDGRHIVFLSDRGGTQNVWRMETDGANPRQLTVGDEGHPSYSPDGRWLVYVGSSSPGIGTIWKVPVDGGAPVQLTDSQSGKPAVSPDGTQIACGYFDDQTMEWRIALLPFEGGKPTRMFDLPASMTYAGGIGRWTADGRALTYIDTRGDVSNVWRLPLDGSPPRQLTDFKAERIFWFDWSHDGHQLALARGTVTSDVVMIRDYR